MSRAGAKPITRQRSAWTQGPAYSIPTPDGPTITAAVWQRNVHDGHLSVLMAQEPGIGWHLSISHRTNTSPPRPGRYPTWDEITDARYRFLPTELDFVMHLPPPGEYVAVHDTTFHLHEHPEPESDQ